MAGLLKKLGQFFHKIAGLSREPEYQSGERGDSWLSDALWDLLEFGNFSSLTDAQLDHVSRVLAGGLAEVEEVWLRRHFKVCGWKKGGPLCKEGTYHSGGWLDHLSKLVDKKSGEVIYRSEPYRLDESGLRELLALEDRGWRVIIDPRWSSHYPGRTMSVMVTRKNTTDQFPELRS